jgi:uncharacterized protein YihD (DUF1040 family)
MYAHDGLLKMLIQDLVAKSGIKRISGDITREIILLSLSMVSSAGFTEDINYRVVIRFGSVCCGTHSIASDYIYVVIAEREKLIGKTLEQEKVHWGKEGEYNLCMMLHELTADEQEKFVGQLELATTRPGTVQVDGNVPCESVWQ